MKVKSITECCNTFDLYYAIIGLENQFLHFLEWSFYTGFTVEGLYLVSQIRSINSLYKGVLWQIDSAG